ANTGKGSSVVSTVDLRAVAMRNVGRGFQFQLAAGVQYNGISLNDASVGTSDLVNSNSDLQGKTLQFLAITDRSDATFGWYMQPSVGNSKFNFTSGFRLDGGKTYGSGGGQPA